MRNIAIWLLVASLGLCCQASGQRGMISMPVSPESLSPDTSRTQKAQLIENYGKLPLNFEANTGQADTSVKFFSRSSGYGVYLMDEEAALVLDEGGCAGLPSAHTGPPAFSGRRLGLERTEAACTRKATVVRMWLDGSSGTAAPAGEEPLPGTANYFIGNDPAQWHTSVPTYAGVRYRGVYPGVDLVYYGNQRQLEYDFVVAPGGDPKSIRLRFAGVKALRLGADGDLVLTVADGAIAFHKPVVYQGVNGQRKPISSGFTLLSGRTVGFDLGSYDRRKPVVIDPVLAYSTYLGGTSADRASAIAVDADGNAYIIGSAGSADFPVTQGALQKTNNAPANYPFVTKLNPTGTALLYSTYLGGSGGDAAHGLAVDSSGNTYIAGGTDSSDFPTTKGAFQTTKPGSPTGFVSKLNPTGSALVYSTYLGGSMGGTFTGDFVSGLAIDSMGNAYVAGTTYSTDFPVTAGAFQTGNQGVSCSNAFVTKLNPTGSALVYSTYLGGSGAVQFSIGPPPSRSGGRSDWVVCGQRRECIRNWLCLLR